MDIVRFDIKHNSGRYYITSDKIDTVGYINNTLEIITNGQTIRLCGGVNDNDFAERWYNHIIYEIKDYARYGYEG